MAFEYSGQKIFYNCNVKLYDSEERLLGTSYFHQYKPDNRYVSGIEVYEDNDSIRVTKISGSLLENGNYHVIVENKLGSIKK